MTKGLIIGVFLTLSGMQVMAQNWYKGNLHTHSLWSDGDGYPEMIMGWYKSHGYNFVGLSDHNVIQEGVKSKRLSNETDRIAFDRYMAKYGASWVDFKKRTQGDTVVRVKTLEEYRGRFEQPGKFMIFESEEITSNDNGIPIHMVATNIKYVTPGQYGRSIPEVIQKTVDKIAEQRKETGLKSIVQLNHPNFGFAITAADIMKVNHLRFFEVYNGAPATHNYGDETHDSTEVIWDKVNLHRVKAGDPLLLGLGVDDAHHYQMIRTGLNNPGRAWIMVYAPRLAPASIITAMEAGRFYTSTGVTLKTLNFSSKEISLEVEAGEGITYRIMFIGVRKGSDRARILKEVTGPRASYTLRSGDLFVRAKIVSSKVRENVYPGDVETAWTQPVTGK